MCVDLNIRAAGSAMQVRLVSRFHAGLAQEIIIGVNQRLVGIFLSFQRFPFIAVDSAHRAEEMRGQGAARIPADGFRLGADTGQERFVFFNLRHRRHRHIQRDSEWVIWVLLNIGDSLPDVVGCDMEQAGQPVQRRRVFGNFGRGIDGEAGAVGGQQDAVPVSDRAARGARADAARLVGGGSIAEIVAVRDLQVPEPGDQGQKQTAMTSPNPQARWPIARFVC